MSSVCLPAYTQLKIIHYIAVVFLYMGSTDGSVVQFCDVGHKSGIVMCFSEICECIKHKSLTNQGYIFT